MKIDESIKVASWGKQFQPNKSEQNREIFQKYSQTQKNTYEMEEELMNYPSEEIQIHTIQGGFRKLKNEQIEKLKDLKSQYEEIRKIATDYAAPRGSRTPSMHSSSQSVTQQVMSPKGSKLKTNSNREVQILQLQKKQLEIMVQNSMKKIEELLHNQMQYKKAIHELKLQRENKNGSEGDNQALSKLLKRREKDFNERVKVLQLQRQTFFSAMTTYKDRIKYLQSSLGNSEQQLRKILDEKRNFEQLIRMEKDRYMNLQIQFRRQKREHEIVQKDKNAQINRLLKLKDIKESSTDRQLRNKINDLQDEIKVKEQRYNILLDKFQTYQKQQKERLREEKQKQKEKEKEHEIRVVNQILSKSSSIDPQNKALQQTITNILQRVVDLEKKPIIEIDNIINHEQEAHQQTVLQLEAKNVELLKQLDERQKRIYQIKEENQRILSINEKLQRDLRIKSQNEELLNEEIQKLKKFERSFKKDKSNDRFRDFKIITQPTYSAPPVNNQQIRSLQTKLNIISKDYQLLKSQKASLQQQNRQLRLTISQLEFQVQKRQKEKEFSLTLHEKAYNNKYEDLNSTNITLKQQVSNLASEVNRYEQELQNIRTSNAQEVQRLKQTIQNYKRQKSNMDSMIKESAVSSVNKLRSENNTKISELVSTIEKLTAQNQRSRQERQEYFAVYEENQKLVQLIKQMRFINGECDRLWNAKEVQYEKIDGILQVVRK